MLGCFGAIQQILYAISPFPLLILFPSTSSLEPSNAFKAFVAFGVIRLFQQLAYVGD